MSRGWTVLAKEQFWVSLSLLGLTALAWTYLLGMTLHDGSTGAMSGMDMADMDMSEMAMSSDDATGRVTATALMWAVMMVGMMLPGAMPMVLLFSAVQRRNAAHPNVAVAAFVTGYLAVWGGFSILAALLQSWLAQQMLLSPALALADGRAAAIVLLVAGLYELSPVKARCLDGCRGPVAFIAAHWRPGLVGAWRMGVVHGLYCLGCCWAMMLLLFVLGVMNLAWVAVLTAVVLVQKIAARSGALSRIGGLGLSGLAILLLLDVF